MAARCVNSRLVMECLGMCVYRYRKYGVNRA